MKRQQVELNPSLIKIIISTIFLLMLSSCIITNTPGFYTGYNRLSDNDKKKIIFVDKDSSICNFVNNDKIYAITGKQLRSCLMKNDTSIVYFWGPNCSSKSCISIAACQNYCTSKNYSLYVVADYYEIEKMQNQNVSNFPMLIANQQYYNKTYANSLNKRFTDDLLNGVNLNKEEQYNRFLLFKGDKLIKSKSNMFEE